MGKIFFFLLNLSYEKNLFLRYFFIILLFLIIKSNYFINFLLFIFNNLSYLFLNIFSKTILINSSLNILNFNFIFSIVKPCLGLESYLLFIFIFLSIPINFLLSLKLIFKLSLIFTFLNLLRILVLMFIALKFSIELQDKIHLFFYSGLTGIISISILIYFLKKEKISKIYPLISDINYLIKKIF